MRYRLSRRPVLSVSDYPLIVRFEALLRVDPAGVLAVGRRLFGVVFDPSNATIAQMREVSAQWEQSLLRAGSL